MARRKRRRRKAGVSNEGRVAMAGNIKQLCLVSKDGLIRIVENWYCDGYPVFRAPKRRHPWLGGFGVVDPSVIFETVEYRVLPGHTVDSDILILEET